MNLNYKTWYGFSNKNECIYLLQGDIFKYQDYFKQEKLARYNTVLKWYLVGDIPSDLPSDITPVKLTWNEFEVVPEDEMQSFVDSKLGSSSKSVFQGNIGDRLELHLLVKAIFPIEGKYGHGNMYLMKDNNENVYIWSTNSKKLELNTEYDMRGTVKSHENYRGVNQTVLTRCRLK